MYGALQIQEQRKRRVQVRGSSSSGVGLNSLPISQLQRSSIINRHFQTVFRKQQREAGALRKGSQAKGMEEQCDRPQGKERAAWKWTVIRNEERGQTEQGKLVRCYVAVLRLVSRHGCFEVGIHQRGISGKQFQTSKKWSKERQHSFRKWSREITHYFKKWSYAGSLRPTLYFRF